MSVLTDDEKRELVAEARRLEGDYGDNYEVMCHMSVLADALEGTLTEPEWEYRPGHADSRMEGGFFVQSGVIAPGYVDQYLAEGGEVIRRRVGPWEVVPDV